MNDYSKRLQEIAPAILNEELDYLELSNALKSYKELLLEISSLEMDGEANRDNIMLNHGLAIGPAWAARCLDDIMRTKRFVRGVFLAVSQVITEKKQPVHILYSGTGPFATLVLPLLSCFTPEEIQFTLIEVNPISFKHVQNVFKSFGAESYLKNVILEDATKIKLADAKEIDVIVIECLQHALAKEPQVAITNNLVKQCRKDVLLIPEEISLQLSLINKTVEYNNEVLDSEKSKIKSNRVDKKVFELSKNSMLQSRLNGEDYFLFPEKETRFHSSEIGNNNFLAVSTTIKTFGNEILKKDESGLTIPFIYSEIDKNKGDMVVSTQYEVSDSPKLLISLKE